MRFDGSVVSSVPANRTEPLRRPMMPITARSVVVLPAPLRPSNVTSSPSPTANSMPCSTCDSPYQALRPATGSSSGIGRRGFGAGAHIGLDDPGVGRDGFVVALGEDAAAGQHSDRVAQIGDDRG